MKSTDVITQTAAHTLSVVVNAHSEGRLLRPTLKSIGSAIAVVAAGDVSCELILVLDNPTPATVREANRWAEPGRVAASARVVLVANGDAGASRNSGAASATGKYLAFCDGDDLVSRNYFSESLKILSASSGRLILHPGTVVSFGARSLRWTIPSTEDIDFRDLIRDNLWPSASISQRSTYTDFPYPVMRPEEGFGPEDWLWNIRTSIAQIPHRPALGTMFFYRVRESGGVNNRHTHSILPGFDTDGLEHAMPIKPPSASVVAPKGFRRGFRRFFRLAYRFARPLIRVIFSFLDQGQKERLYARGVAIYRGERVAHSMQTVSPAVLELLRDVSEIEPAMSWTAHEYAKLPDWNPHKDNYASLLVTMVEQLQPWSRAIVAVPWVGIGGADLVSINYARALLEDERFGGQVSMLATYTPSKTHRELVPPGINFVQVPEAFRELTPNQQRRLLAQAFLILKPELVLSVNCFDVTNSLQFYGNQLGAAIRIYLTLFAFDRIGDGYPVNPITDDGQRGYLDNIKAIITDNSITAEIVSEMLVLDDTQVRVHHQPALYPIPRLRTGTRAYNNQFFSEKNPFRVVWPHRLDSEKRPESLIAIANLLRGQGLNVEINVYGQQVLSVGGKALMNSLRESGVVYRGPYSGGLMSLPTESFHALLLTSQSEGLPLVLVQSMLLGLPVIATSVGGVPNIVRDGETGLLVSGPEDAAGFVASIRQLMESLEYRRKLIDAAYDFAVAQHGWQAFTRLVDDL